MLTGASIPRLSGKASERALHDGCVPPKISVIQVHCKCMFGAASVADTGCHLWVRLGISGGASYFTPEWCQSQINTSSGKSFHYKTECLYFNLIINVKHIINTFISITLMNLSGRDTGQSWWACAHPGPPIHLPLGSICPKPLLIFLLSESFGQRKLHF